MADQMSTTSPIEYFRVLEHPSDLGIEATGATLAAAFEQAALGLISVIAEAESIGECEERMVELEAQDSESLLVRWLSEILYLYDGEDFLLKKPRIETIEGTRLIARLRGEKYNPGKHRLKLDVKAITYHQLSIKSTNGTTTVRVFFDI